MRRLMFAVVAVLSATVLTGCDPSGNGSDSAGQAGSGGGAVPRPAGCRQAGPLTRDFLAQFPPAGTTTIENPCLEFAGLVGQVTGLARGESKSKVDKLLTGVGDIAGKVSTFDDALSCGYETDRLAINVYQDQRTRWSIGVVAVVRGTTGVLVDGAKCFLRKQFLFDLEIVGTEDPKASFCLEEQTRSRGGERYTVLWLGSSDVMCWQLENQLRPGRERDEGFSATVKADPDVAVRDQPGTAAKSLRRAVSGEVLTVRCYRAGDPVSGRRGESRNWYFVPLDDGYIAGAWLDTGDKGDKPGECDPT